MTSKRFIRRFNAGRITPKKSRAMNLVRWTADRARRDAEEPQRFSERAAIETENLPCKPGDPLGCLQWTDYRTGRVRRWIVRIGARMDQVTLQAPGKQPSSSHGWAWVLTKLRAHLCRPQTN
jgi:hypothetical protein